jgi:hypothetical protein
MIVMTMMMMITVAAVVTMTITATTTTNIMDVSDYKSKQQKRNVSNFSSELL